MANDLENPEDVSAMMEALWGPRTTGPPASASRQNDRAGEVPLRAVPAIDDPETRHAEADEALRRQFAVVRSELAAAVAAVDAKLTVLGEALRQGDARATAVGAELKRRQDAAVDRDEFVALRSELQDALSGHMSAAQAELQRRVALLDAAIADAKAQMGRRLDEMAALVSAEAALATEQASARAAVASEPLQREVQSLQEQVQQLSTVVAALQRGFPAP